MSKLSIVILSIFVLLNCFGCGNDSGKDFKNYAQEPALTENYQKYFLYEYCDEAYKFTEEYEDTVNGIKEILNKNKPVKVSYEMGFISPDVTWEKTYSDSDFYYYGEMDNGKPKGLGCIVVKVKNGEMLKVYSGNFNDGKFDGYGILYEWFLSDHVKLFSRLNPSVFPKMDAYIPLDGKVVACKGIAGNDYDKDILMNYDISNLELKYKNHMTFEGNFDDGLRDGKGIIYKYRSDGFWIDACTGRFKQSLLDEIKNCKNKIEENKKNNYYLGMETLKSKIKNAEQTLEFIESLPKVDTPSLMVTGRLFVISAEFNDQEFDGKVVCYTQESTSNIGYKLYELETSDNSMEACKMWDSHGEIIVENDNNEFAKRLIERINKSEFVVKSYPLSKIK